MVDRRIGRTERLELGHRRVEARRLPEAQYGDMREPRPLLALIDAEGLQSVEEPSGEPSAFLCAIVEHEHPHAAGLAVAARREHDVGGFSRSVGQRHRDRRQLAGRPSAEEREREVEMLARDDPALAEMLVLPGLEVVQDAVGKPERAEEPEVLIAPEVTGGSHALRVDSVSRLDAAGGAPKPRPCA
jgi:hypothetical protein